VQEGNVKILGSPSESVIGENKFVGVEVCVKGGLLGDLIVGFRAGLMGSEAWAALRAEEQRLSVESARNITEAWQRPRFVDAGPVDYVSGAMTPRKVWRKKKRKRRKKYLGLRQGPPRMIMGS